MVEPSGVGWGGSTLSPMGTSSPSMGSGHLPDKDYVHASYFRDIGIQVDDSGIYNQPSGDKYVDADADAASCYNVEYYGDQGEEFGYSLQFGGPGSRLRHHLNPIASARVGEMWNSSDIVVANIGCPLWSRINILQQDFSPSKQPASIQYVPNGSTTTHQKLLQCKD
ncbi:hypothetical protein L195_g045639 [Trifolium pratense]|uniref:Neprosin PEP catalytic domain-containing protein n=1 Tax=Trifolium pratense TaxID=57577 RepID=A0A2K3LWZ3_TRIPR|nr:hypothetical protein L195_g039093 [Trifolium pratense]PNX89519.1 hypothetical protein L195_g045639 [Trifolium pratense]